MPDNTKDPHRAMVFAAGLGTRMQPITDTMPKPLIKVAGKSLIDYTLELFDNFKIEDIIVNLHYFPEKLDSHLSSLTLCNSTIKISHEDELLETAGGIVKALPMLGHRPFFTANSDSIIIDKESSSSLCNLVEFWCPEKMDALMLLQPTRLAVGYDGAGDFNIEKDGKLIKSSGQNDYVYTGLQIIKPELFWGYIEEPFSLRVIYNQIVPKGRLYGVVHEGDWLHVGTPEAIELAEDKIMALA